MEKISNFIRLAVFGLAVTALAVIQSQAAAAELSRLSHAEASAFDFVAMPTAPIDSAVDDETFLRGF